MKKKLIVAIVLLSIVLAAAVGAVVYLESNHQNDPAVTDPSSAMDTSAPQEDTTAAQETEAPVEETVGISLPTENPDEVGPEYTWPENETGPQETAAPVDPDATWDPDENETPEMGV